MDWIEFSRKMLHDIANPLLVVRLQLWNLKQADVDSLEKAVEDVEHEVDYLEGLIRESREVLKMEAPTGEATPLTAEDVRKVFEEVESRFHQLDCQYELADWEGVPLPVGVLRLIVGELASNAVEAGAGCLIFYQEADRLICTDDGSPFSEAAVQEGLTPFFSSKERGIGLGLVKVRRALEVYHGGVELEATRKTKKARVHLILPRSP